MSDRGIGRAPLSGGEARDSGHFQDAWVGSVTAGTDASGNASGLAFTATIVVGGDNLVNRPQLTQVAP